MSQLRTLARLLCLLPLAGCVAAPVAQLAAQALAPAATSPAMPVEQVAQAPGAGQVPGPGGMAQVAHGFGQLMQQITGTPHP